MDKISNFKYIKDEFNEDNATVFDRIPTGISWQSDSKQYKIVNLEDKLYSDIDASNDLIAIVEGPYSEEISKNRAYIVNTENKIVTDIKALLIKTTKFSSPPYFIGIESTSEGFMFYINYKNRDFRFLFDPKFEKIGDLVESR